MVVLTQGSGMAHLCYRQRWVKSGVLQKTKNPEIVWMCPKTNAPKPLNHLNPEVRRTSQVITVVTHL